MITRSKSSKFANLCTVFVENLEESASNILFLLRCIAAMLALGNVVNVIPDEILKGLADLWGLTPMEGVLKV